MPSVLHVPPDHPLNRVPEALKARIVAAQSDALEAEFPDAHAFAARVFADLKIAIAPDAQLKASPAAHLGDMPTQDLVAYYETTLLANGIPAQAAPLQAANLAHRTQLIRAYKFPDAVVAETCGKVVGVSNVFPKTADDIRRGRNPGDVLDPYILAAVQTLVCAGDFEQTVSAAVSHKALMIIEGLLGHLHEDAIGAMRGNVRVPEPRGDDQETLDPATNPFPGADVLQPPLATGRGLKFHQVKSKTGSAKGGDGKRLGLQLAALTALYGGEAFYDALIGNTLQGHRSMAGVRAAATGVVVLVGEAAFHELTGSTAGPQLLLRLYQSAFDVAARQTGYTLKDAVAAIVAAFRQRADDLGEGFLDAVMHDAVSGPVAAQDSRVYAGGRRRPAR